MKKILLILSVITLIIAFGCSKENPSEPQVVQQTVIVTGTHTDTPTITPTNTDTPDYTATATQTIYVLLPTNTITQTNTPDYSATPTFTVTATSTSTPDFYIDAQIHGAATNNVYTVNVSNASGPVSNATITITDYVEDVTYTIPGVIPGTYQRTGASVPAATYNEGGTYRVDVIFGGQTYSALGIAPKTILVSENPDWTDVRVSWDSLYNYGEEGNNNGTIHLGGPAGQDCHNAYNASSIYYIPSAAFSVGSGTYQAMATIKNKYSTGVSGVFPGCKSISDLVVMETFFLNVTKP